MRAFAISFILTATLTAIPAAADYSSIQHNLFSPNSVVTFNHFSGELHVQSMNAGQMTLNDPVALAGTVSSIGLELVTKFDYVDASGIAHFWGGSLSVAFVFDPAGPTPAAAHALSGPIVEFLFEISQTGPHSRIDGLAAWVATTVDLPGSGIWDDSGLASVLESLSMAFDEDLSDFNWDRSIAGSVESLYYLFPYGWSESCSYSPARYLIDFDSATRLLRIERDMSTGRGYAYDRGQCLSTYVLQMHLDSLTSDGAAFFTGGTLQTTVSSYFTWSGSLQGQATYLWLTQQAYGATVKLSGAGRWDPTLTSVDIPWPDGSALCSFDGLSHLGVGLVMIDDPPVVIDWSGDWTASAFGFGMDLALQECPTTTCAYPFGDLELDCDVDLRDYAAAQRCLAGTASVADKIAGLRVLDADGDLDTDLADFALWEMDGPQSAPQSCCSGN